MKILKEAKENLPVTFLTAFVSDGWEKVGILKEQIEAIKREFKGTKKVEGLLQDLIDAYLVCIGQMEQHLSAKDYLDLETDVKEALKENINEEEPKIATVAPQIEKNKEDKIEVEMELPDYKVNAEQTDKNIAINVSAKPNPSTNKADDFHIEDEWPEPDMSDTHDIEDAKAALASGTLTIGEPTIASASSLSASKAKEEKIEDKVEENDKKADVSDYFIDDFPEPDLAHKITDKDLYED